MSSEEHKPIPNNLAPSWLETPAVKRRVHSIANHFVRKYQLSSVTEDDLSQVVMVKLFRYFRGSNAQEIKRPSAFLFTVVGNEARRIFAEEQGSEITPLVDMPDETFSDHFETAQRIESGMLLREVLDSLEAKERHVFELWLNGASYRELAKLLSSSHVTARTRVSEIIEKIQGSIFSRR